MNNSPHLTDDELIDRIYGLGDTAQHLADCPECSGRLLQMNEARAATVDAPEIPGRTLAVQRQKILQRVAHPPRPVVLQWIPAAAAATLLAAAMILSRHAAVPHPSPATVNVESDAALFTDVYSMEQDLEPRAAAPIRNLFQEASFETEKERQ